MTWSACGRCERCARHRAHNRNGLSRQVYLLAVVLKRTGRTLRQKCILRPKTSRQLWVLHRRIAPVPPKDPRNDGLWQWAKYATNGLTLRPPEGPHRLLCPCNKKSPWAWPLVPLQPCLQKNMYGFGVVKIDNTTFRSAKTSMGWKQGSWDDPPSFFLQSGYKGYAALQRIVIEQQCCFV